MTTTLLPGAGSHSVVSSTGSPEPALNTVTSSRAHRPWRVSSAQGQGGVELCVWYGHL